MLVTEPDDGIAPFLALIKKATHSLDLVMYELTDPAVVTALDAAAARGVAVRVILNRTFPSSGDEFLSASARAPNDRAFAALSAAHVAVRWASDDFTFTHEKAMVVDGAHGFIMSFNLVPKYYPTGRDFGVIDDDAADVAAMESTFNDDWNGDPDGDAAPTGDDLVWSPGSRAAILNMIQSAAHSLDIYNEEMADDDVVAALVAAARRGVDVRIIMTTSPSWTTAFRTLTVAGAHVYTYPATASALYIHAKMIVADAARAFIGSENFSETSLDHNRELGVLITNPAIITSLKRTFAADQGGAIPFTPP